MFIININIITITILLLFCSASWIIDGGLGSISWGTLLLRRKQRPNELKYASNSHHYHSTLHHENNHEDDNNNISITSSNSSSDTGFYLGLVLAVIFNTLGAWIR